MISIDGSSGEGGGQIFRTSLTLSMCTGQPFRIHNIRSGRNKPGLLRQHLTCLNAARSICNARVEGAELGSHSVVFIPGKPVSGDYRFSVGSAGSTCLVFQTVFLPLALASGESTVVLEGGTHNGYAPSFDYLATCFLPVVQKIGFNAELRLDEFGFYPAGGGSWHAKITPPKNELEKLSLTSRGRLVREHAMATSSRVPEHVTQRELAYIQRKLGWHQGDMHQQLVESAGPGNIVSLRAEFENVKEMAECVGERHLSAERVAGRAVRQMKEYLNSGACVGEHLADQLLVPMILGAGGEFTMQTPSQHFLTNADVIRQFTNTDILVKKLDEIRYQVFVSCSNVHAGVAAKVPARNN